MVRPMQYNNKYIQFSIHNAQAKHILRPILMYRLNWIVNDLELNDAENLFIVDDWLHCIFETFFTNKHPNNTVRPNQGLLCTFISNVVLCYCSEIRICMAFGINLLVNETYRKTYFSPFTYLYLQRKKERKNIP